MSSSDLSSIPDDYLSSDVDGENVDGNHRDNDDYYRPSSEDEMIYASPSSSSFLGSENDMDENEELDEGEERKVLPKRIVLAADDDSQITYKKRLQDWWNSLEIKNAPPIPVPDRKGQQVIALIDFIQDWLEGSPITKDLFMPSIIKEKLYPYQLDGVKWLWQLYKKQVGGILGDEMGLGKTIQTISFLSCLWCCKKLKGPILISCPATLLAQWTEEFRTWWPPFRIILLHSSGQHAKDDEGTEDDERLNSADQMKITKETLGKIKQNSSTPGTIFLTTYSGLYVHREAFFQFTWDYVILDEGHKIKNPSTLVAQVCKKLKCLHRIILSGTPMQNNLTELWSLFDFIYPGHLGTLEAFEEQFSIPISVGGYANASRLAARTAYETLLLLRDLVQPYLLKRSKLLLLDQIPAKTERVVLCRLTKEQARLYQEFLKSDNMTKIHEGELNVLCGVNILQKICNHPVLAKSHFFPPPPPSSSTATVSEMDGEEDERHSGKLIILKGMLKSWHQGGDRVLIFSQRRQCLDLIVTLLDHLGYTHLRMDGLTPIHLRIPLVKAFNEDSSIFAFLLTTRVGGLGINLTGANRVVIYDPDWNPSTDVQARERVWRIGQQRPVCVYRLVTVGTIEEKMYHRQLFKQALSHQVLSRRSRTNNDGEEVKGIITSKNLFKSHHLHDLFHYDPVAALDPTAATTTTAMFPEAKLASSLAEDGGGGEDEMLLKLLAKHIGIEGVLDHESVVSSCAAKNNNELIDQEAKLAAKRALKTLDASFPSLPPPNLDSVPGLERGKINGLELLARLPNPGGIPDQSIGIIFLNKKISNDHRVWGLLEITRDKIIQEFFSQGGMMTSAEVVSFIKQKLPLQGLEKVRPLLKQVAVYRTFDEEAGGGGYWQLKKRKFT